MANHRMHPTYVAIDPYNLAEDIRRLLGPTPQVFVEKFENWAGTQRVKAAIKVRPRTLPELQAIIQVANHLHLEVRAVGAAHTFSPLFHSGGRQILIYVEDLQRPDGDTRIEILPNPQRDGTSYVTIPAGMTTGEFLDFQISYGVCIPANVVLRTVTMGGVVAGASHGVGNDTTPVCDRVVRMKIVDSHGQLRTYSREEDLDMLRAVQCNLGLWGIMMELTLKVDPMFAVEVTHEMFKVRDIFFNPEKFKEVVTSNLSTQVMWFPFGSLSIYEGLEVFFQKKIDPGDWNPMEDDVIVRIVNRKNIPGLVPGSDIYNEIYRSGESAGKKVTNFYGPLIDALEEHPHAFPLMSRLQKPFLDDIYERNPTLQLLPQSIHHPQNIQIAVNRESEWAFSVDQDFKNVCFATQGMVNVIHAFATRGSFPMFLPTEMRFIKGSDAYLAPASCGNKTDGGSGLTCCLEWLSGNDAPDWEEFTSTVVQQVMLKIPGVRPHWCKEWTYIPKIDVHLKQVYGDRIPRYLSALERSGADPGGMFLNETLEKLFYPNGHPGKLQNPYPKVIIPKNIGSDTKCNVL